jgi:hypothetical protein
MSPRIGAEGLSLLSTTSVGLQLDEGGAAGFFGGAGRAERPRQREANARTFARQAAHGFTSRSSCTGARSTTR